MNKDRYLKMLDFAYGYAKKHTGCLKVAVGCGIYDVDDELMCWGANKVFDDYCKNKGCYRKELYGDDGKEHRLPSDCLAIHAEIEAISKYQRFANTPMYTIVITRYPCEACARAIVAADISEVIYGGEQEISDMTKKLFEHKGVKVTHIKDWKTEYDTSR